MAAPTANFTRTAKWARVNILGRYCSKLIRQPPSYRFALRLGVKNGRPSRGTADLSELTVSGEISARVRTGIGRELAITKRRLRNTTNFRFWLDSEVQRPEFDVRLYPSFRHSGQGWEGLNLTRLGHSGLDYPSYPPMEVRGNSGQSVQQLRIWLLGSGAIA
jgi:hypothetical protein